ncbi:hypothetical protein A2276_00085 [candidate division WOR-1 bacterium RIFOXYA12_FULL_43_27]|nr:MAG: hypothetical protein A2276_00085 [candidate division WOR-1 bacterium RIFOXYA12_FULL_43_27]
MPIGGLGIINPEAIKMTDQRPTASELLNQVAEFENTLSTLQKNVSELKNRLMRNRDQHGDDVSQWPNL